MKTLSLFTACALIALGACTEIEYRDVEKEILKHDTITKYVDRLFIGTDTVTIETIVEVPVATPVRNEADTVIRIDTVWVEKIVYVPRIDSVFIVKTIYEHDTIATHEILYGDTLFVWSGGRGVYSVPRDLQEYVNFFYDRAAALNIPTTGPGWLIIEVQPIDRVLQAYSFTFWWQWSIVVNDRLTVDQMFIPVLREMLRKELGKEYSADPQNPMNPFFDTSKIRWSNRSQHQEEINAMFTH